MTSWPHHPPQQQQQAITAAAAAAATAASAAAAIVAASVTAIVVKPLNQTTQLCYIVTKCFVLEFKKDSVSIGQY